MKLDQKSLQSAFLKIDQPYLVLTIIVFHVAGLIGFYNSASHALFLTLVPWHLLLMLAIVGGSHRPADLKFLIFTLLIYIAAMIIEWEGVNSKALFGYYTYSNVLGSKMDGAPFCIGVNWFLLIYSTGVVMKKSRVRSMVIRVICGALLLVLLDLLIEPVAMNLHYWYWFNNNVPFRNYVAWFVVSAAMLTVFELFKFKKQGIVAPIFLLVQFIFFACLCLTL